ncbi:MAG: VOC family protein [Fibrella sp.]|nr:VOC family protein [Armatimonadota bacterium]
MITLGKPHHIGITVSDIERSVAWYADTLGFTEKRRVHVAERGLTIVLAEREGFVIELFEKTDSTPIRAEERDVPTSLGYGGYRHLAFTVPSVDEVWAEFEATGQDLVVPPTDNEKLGFRLCFIRDPDGVLLEFVQPLS